MSEMHREKLELSLGKIRVTVEVPDSRRVEGLPMIWFQDWLVFSGLESEILLCLLEKGPKKRETLAAAVDRSEDSIKGIIANLSARRIIAPGPEGYTVNFPRERRQEMIDYLRTTFGGDQKTQTPAGNP